MKQVVNFVLLKTISNICFNIEFGLLLSISLQWIKVPNSLYPVPLCWKSKYINCYKMKILQVINNLVAGGAEKLIIDTVPLYQAEGVVMDVLCLNKTKTPFWELLETKTKGSIIGLSNGSLYNPLLIFKLIPFLKKYDIIHAHLFPTLYWVVLAKWLSFSKAKIVYTEHNTSNSRRNNKVFSFIDRLIYKGVYKVITIAEEVDQNIKKHLRADGEKFVLIKNAVDVTAYVNAIPYPKADFFSNDDFILIQVSSFRAQKDQATLINALKHLPEKYKLLLVGVGPTKQEHEQLVVDLELTDRVLFLGTRIDVPKLLKTADIVVLSSFYEGLSLSSIEGMAARPFIASNVPGLSDIVKGYGLLFEQGNSEELADLILKLDQDKELYQKVGRQCLERAQQFDVKIMIEKHINLYKSVLTIS